MSQMDHRPDILAEPDEQKMRSPRKPVGFRLFSCNTHLLSGLAKHQSKPSIHHKNGPNPFLWLKSRSSGSGFPAKHALKKMSISGKTRPTQGMSCKNTPAQKAGYPHPQKKRSHMPTMFLHPRRSILGGHLYASFIGREALRGRWAVI